MNSYFELVTDPKEVNLVVIKERKICLKKRTDTIKISLGFGFCPPMALRTWYNWYHSHLHITQNF